MPANEISPRLFLGSMEDGADAHFLVENKVSHILAVMSPHEMRYPVRYATVAYKHVDLQDDPKAPIEDSIEITNKWIDAALSDPVAVVLVHCRLGMSRSAATVCGYLMRRDGLTFDGALALVKRARPIASPNSGFIEKLKGAEKVWTKK